MQTAEKITQGLDNILESLHPLIKDALELGHKVYARPDGLLGQKVVGIYFTDGINIGSCYYDRLEGFCFSTIHKPSHSNGTGGQVVRGLGYFVGITDYIPQSMAYVPSWWNSGAVEKYRDFDQYNRQYHNGKLIEIVL